MTQIETSMVHECFFLDFIKIFVKSLQHKTHRKKTASLNAGGFSKKFQLFNICMVKGLMLMQTPLVHQPDFSTFGLLTVE